LRMQDNETTSVHVTLLHDAQRAHQSI
jgi:hypothetical protein